MATERRKVSICIVTSVSAGFLGNARKQAPGIGDALIDKDICTAFKFITLEPRKQW